MKRTLKIACTAAAILSFSHSASAVLVGEINVGAFGSTADVDFTANTVEFTPSSPANNAIVTLALGDFAGLLGTFATYTDFTYAPLSVTNPIWRVDADTYFDLGSIGSIDENPGAPSLSLTGRGTLYHDGDSAPGKWSFSADESGSAFSFSSTNAVPDGGASVALFGLSLLGLGGVRRFILKKA